MATTGKDLLITMKTQLKVKRYNPEADSNSSFFETFSLEVDNSTTVLDALIKIREEIDGTLAIRCSCRASICGSCGMVVNGKARLVCKTRIDEFERQSTITVEPMRNHRVIKDLVVDITTFFDQVKRVQPYLKTDQLPEKSEFNASNESMVNLLTSMNCIMCGCCVSDCTVLEVDEQFIGPAALAKAWRFTEDPRDSATSERLKDLNDQQGGIWDCTRCMACVEVCPKDVAPMERIMELRERAIKDGNTKSAGYRHTESFNKSVRKNGRVDETRLALESAGFTNIPRLLDLAEIGLRALIRGKLPPIIPHKAENKENIKNLFERVEQDK